MGAKIRLFVIIALWGNSMFCQVFRNGPNATDQIVDSSFGCYSNVGQGCMDLNVYNCLSYGNWLSDFQSPLVCRNPGAIDNYVRLSKIIGEDEVLHETNLRFFLTDINIEGGPLSILFNCANLGPELGYPGDYSAILSVKVGTNVYTVPMPPYNPNLQSIEWLPVEISFCPENTVEEVTISMDIVNPEESASSIIGLRLFSLGKPRHGCEVSCPECRSFNLNLEEKYIISAWTKVTAQGFYTPIEALSYNNAMISVDFQVDPSENGSVFEFKPSGEIIDGWQRIVGEFTTPPNGSSNVLMSISLMNNYLPNGNIPANMVYFDDIRIHPFNSSLKSFVYDQETQKLLAELDENNYATFYEYDAEGGLIRVKKETEKGIFTIQETRSSNKKRPQKEAP